MDDDVTFGSSVWATPATGPMTLSPSSHEDKLPPFDPPASSPTSGQDDQFDDFDDFGPPADSVQADSAQDDDFGDFGDFGDVEESSVTVVSGSGGFEGFTDDTGFEDPFQAAGPSTSRRGWTPLQLDPHNLPERSELEEQIEEILEPLWADDDLSEVFTDEDIREVGGINQILITPESRSLYQTLFPSTPPSAQPPNWTRSRIRRQHLITLGIPLNLDEFLPRANGKAMPALQITTRPMSAPPGPRPEPGSSNGNANHAPASSTTNSRAGTPRSGTPVSTRPSAAAQLALGPKPTLEEEKIADLLALKTENLSLLPLPLLEKHLANLRQQTSNTSTLLTYLLQTRDALQQDSETYNNRIAELVGEAQRMKSGKGRATARRGSGMT